MRRRLTALALCVLLAGCGAQVREPGADGAPGYPVTIRNCGQAVTYDRPPERVVAYDSGIVEMMFALGLGDRMAGYVLPGSKEAEIASSPWRADYQQVRRLGADSISKEVVLEAGADFVFAGWSYGFREDTGLTPQQLGELGIDSYVLTESCRNGSTESARGIMPPLEALYTDLRNLGQIFGVSDRAERLIAEYQTTVREAEALVRTDRPKPTVFLYDSGTDKPFTAGRFAAANEIITRAGGDSIMHDLQDTWTTVSWETVVERDPDVIVINDYDEPSAAGKRAFLEAHPALAQVSAIRHGRFVVLPYVSLVESPRNPAAVRTMAEYLRTVHVT
ncbi:ABC transporter substrate-binding protein [Saccharomonospora sp. NPDC046836]|uniref:ABC transporter substrate-binding protein n=1 Tax=Saccharomonospora sp. NPDC046836 TaxID=3156921 RepID=UPI0033E38E73